MVDTDQISGLSGAAQQRQRDMLPSLLAAVRWRRRRRQAVRAGASVSLLILFGLWLRPYSTHEAPAVAPVVDATAPAPRWHELHDDPTVLSRCEVRTAVRAEWFVDDDSLQQLLTTGNRTAGLLRIGNQVLVSPTAIDRWGSDAP